MTSEQADLTPLDLLAGNQPAGGSESDLPQRMGRDAQRVARGELDEAAFFDRYHEALMDRFGFDRRPGGEDR